MSKVINDYTTRSYIQNAINCTPKKVHKLSVNEDIKMTYLSYQAIKEGIKELNKPKAMRIQLNCKTYDMFLNKLPTHEKENCIKLNKICGTLVDIINDNEKLPDGVVGFIYSDKTVRYTVINGDISAH